MKKNNQRILIIKILSYATKDRTIHEVTIDDIDDITKKPSPFFRNLSYDNFFKLIKYVKGFLNIQGEPDTFGIGKISWDMYDIEERLIWDFEETFREALPMNTLQKMIASKFTHEIYNMIQSSAVREVLKINQDKDKDTKLLLSPEKFRFK